MELKNGIPTFYAKNQQAWRNWLLKNHATAKSVWLIIYKKETGVPSVYYPEAVDEALCFGWIDSKPNKRNDESYYQFFAKRNPKSNWSKVNKEKIARLIKAKKMHASGMAMVKLAKETGTWNALNDVDKMQVPADMQALFNKNKIAFENWQAFSKSSRRGILEWVLQAKRPETRQKRIEETVALATKNIKANQFIKKP